MDYVLTGWFLELYEELGFLCDVVSVHRELKLGCSWKSLSDTGRTAVRLYWHKQRYNDFNDIDGDDTDELVAGPTYRDILKISFASIVLELSQVPFYHLVVSTMAHKSRYKDIIPYHGLRTAFKSIWKEDGLFGFVRGATAICLTGGLWNFEKFRNQLSSQGIFNFSLGKYPSMKNFPSISSFKQLKSSVSSSNNNLDDTNDSTDLKRSDSNRYSSIDAEIHISRNPLHVSSLFPLIYKSLLLHPFELVAVRTITEKKNEYNDTLSTFTNSWNNIGLNGIFSNFGANLFWTVAKESIKSVLFYNGIVSVVWLDLAEILITFSGIPLLLRVRGISEGNIDHYYLGKIRKIYDQDGIGGFFSHLKVTSSVFFPSFFSFCITRYLIGCALDGKRKSTKSKNRKKALRCKLQDFIKEEEEEEEEEEENK